MLESLACICGVSLKLNTEIQKFTFTDCFFIMISFWFYFVFFFFFSLPPVIPASSISSSVLISMSVLLPFALLIQMLIE